MIALQIVQFIACIFTLAVGLLELNSMGKQTPPLVRYSMLILLAGVAGGVETAFHPVGIFQCITYVGVAGMISWEAAMFGMKA